MFKDDKLLKRYNKFNDFYKKSKSTINTFLEYVSEYGDDISLNDQYNNIVYTMIDNSYLYHNVKQLMKYLHSNGVGDLNHIQSIISDNREYILNSELVKFRTIYNSLTDGVLISGYQSHIKLHDDLYENGRYHDFIYDKYKHLISDDICIFKIDVYKGDITDGCLQLLINEDIKVALLSDDLTLPENPHKLIQDYFNERI